ncbi:hypothetical protein HDU98_010792 [Podochytrium sp. JEL0797]|nr:hypothetical protein HDU98_010792 [Podochytrium sp. JEL0797]
MTWGNSRLNIGGNPPRTCGGAILSDAILANIRGENPVVPVSLIARYPLLGPIVRNLSNIHVWSAIAVLFIIYVQLLTRKGTSVHVALGRFMKYAILSHFFVVAFILNGLAINIPVKDWELSPPLSDWRAQVAYIVPFGITTSVGALIAFARPEGGLSKNMKASLRAASLFSICWWFTVGLYISVSQALGGLGNFGFPVPAEGEAQVFFAPINVVLILVGTMQAGLDWINYLVVGKSLIWIENHKWGIFVFSYQAIVIFANFLAYFPLCAFGFPEWTCILSPIFAVPVMVVMMLPLFPHIIWVATFVPKVMAKSKSHTE